MDEQKTNTDLTAQERSEESESIFKLLVESVKDYAIFMLDADGNIKTWNEGAQRIKGYKANEIIGKHFSIFYPPDALASKHPQHELMIAEREGSYEEQGWRVRKDGSLMWANVVITAVRENGKLVGFAKVTRDLTESKKAQQDEELFQLLVGSVADYAIFMLDPDGKVMTWNEGAQRIKGYKASEVIGQHFSIFYTKDMRLRHHPEKELAIAKKDGRYEEEGWRVRKDGSLFWANVVITAIYQDKKLIGFAKITRDLTQRLLFDQEREMNSKALDDTNKALRVALDVKSQFLSTISHEVRTPMSGIIGLTEILTMEDLGEDTNAVVGSIFNSSKRLLQLLNNLLDSAKMDSGETTLECSSIPIRSIIGEVRQLIMPDAIKKQLKVTGVCDSKIPQYIFGDEQKVRQILLNLAFNAVKFTNVGEVDISASLLEQGDDKITIRFTIKDTGIGIKEQDMGKLFQPFVQAEDSTKTIYGGTGLGLSICKQLVEIMGGQIRFNSVYGKGSTFLCDVPFSLREAERE
jgi:PAS domain S-box-containing protein